MSRKKDYTAWNLFDNSYHQNYYKLIGIDLSRQTNTDIPQQIIFIRKLDKEDGTAIYRIQVAKTIRKFSLDGLNVTEQYKQWNIKKYIIYWMKQVILDMWQENGT